MNETYSVSGRAKSITLGLMGVGLLSLILGFIFADGTRVWANILFNGYYLMGIGMIGGFFVSINYLGYAGWAAIIKRVPEALGTFLPIGGLLVLLVVVGAWLHAHHIYHWNAEDVDALIKGKQAFLNLPFFTIRVVLYIAILTLLFMQLRKNSLAEDQMGGLNFRKRNMTMSALYILFFAVFSSTMSWDLIMSIDAHWFSTLFGWYNFASYFVAGLSTICLFAIYLKSKGLLNGINENHFHDIGKFMFAFSVFWTYLWFSQYMLIWYANIPEETIYYIQRMQNFKFLFFFNLAINFIFPFFVLMTRGSKRNLEVLGTVSVILIFGHWLDFYLMVMPGSVGADAHIGFLEIGTALGFAGLFIFWILNSLSKASTVPVNEPFLKESKLHHI